MTCRNWCTIGDFDAYKQKFDRFYNDAILRRTVGENGYQICVQSIWYYMGEDAEIQFEYMAEIPVLALGKRKTIENLRNK